MATAVRDAFAGFAFAAMNIDLPDLQLPTIMELYRSYKDWRISRGENVEMTGAAPNVGDVLDGRVS